MSGKKRALLGFDAHMTARLTALEARLSSLQADNQAVDKRIAAFRAEEEQRAQAASVARQQALIETMSGVEESFRKLENQTFRALAEQKMSGEAHRQQIAADTSQVTRALASLAYEMDQQRSNAKNVWRSAQETLEAAKALEEGLCAYYPSGLWKNSRPRIDAWIEESEANLYRGQSEAGLMAAQQAYLDLQELHMNMETRFQRQHVMRLSTIQRLNEVLALAESNAVVQAVDLEGRFLDTWIDVNQWSNGLLSRAHTRASAILQQISNQQALFPETDWQELLENQIPGLEQAVCDAVRQARQTVLVLQLRFNVAESVVAALAAQGFTLAHSGWLGQDSQSYLVSLCDYSGNQVSISVSPGPPGSPDMESGQACQLDINYRSQEILSEHILQRSVEEIYASLRSAGLDVVALPAPDSHNSSAPWRQVRPAVQRRQPRQPVLQHSHS